MSEFLLYKLWDLGLKVGQAVRSVSETHQARPERPHACRPALLEARLLWGSRAAVRPAAARAYEREIVAGRGAAFAEAKLAERDQRHQRMGDSRFLLEPNIKEGKGGLRDLQTLLWIARFLYRSEDPGETGPAGPAHPPGAGHASCARAASCGPCAATSTISPAAPRTG